MTLEGLLICTGHAQTMSALAHSVTTTLWVQTIITPVLQSRRLSLEEVTNVHKVTSW